MFSSRLLPGERDPTERADDRLDIGNIIDGVDRLGQRGRITPERDRIDRRLVFLVPRARGLLRPFRRRVRRPTTIAAATSATHAGTSSSVTPEYLEAVTRDTAQLALNRSPETLQYWLDGIVAIAAPESRGALKAKLMEIMAEQEGSQVTQFVTIDWIRTDPDELTSQVGGVLHTIVGSRDVRREHKVFEFHWKYTGVSLRLKGFGVVVKEGEEE